MIWTCYVFAALATFFTLGTFAWQTPFVGLFGSLGGYLPGWLLLMAGIGAGTGTVAWIDDPSPTIALAIAASLLSFAGGVKVILDQRAALSTVDVAVRPGDFFGPFLAKTTGADEIIEYGPVDGHTSKMAVYRPAPSDTPARTVVHVHGGAWMSGNESSDARFLRYLADRGYLVFSPTYVPAADDAPTWDLAPRQIARAIVTAAGLRARYGGAGGGLLVMGASAGGQLATLVANRLASGDDFGMTGEPIPSITAVAAHIPAIDPGLSQGMPYAMIGPKARSITEIYTGGTPEEVPERYEAVNATNFLDDRSPPTLLVYGDNDWLVPSQASMSFAQRARTLGVEVRTFGVPWTGHLIGLSGAGGRAIAELTVRWFDDHG